VSLLKTMQPLVAVISPDDPTYSPPPESAELLITCVLFSDAEPDLIKSPPPEPLAELLNSCAPVSDAEPP
jgi:hypothetical protein